MEEKEIDAVKSYRTEAIKAARQLCYGFEVLDQLKKAKTEGEIRTIMAEARRNSR